MPDRNVPCGPFCPLRIEQKCLQIVNTFWNLHFGTLIMYMIFLTDLASYNSYTIQFTQLKVYNSGFFLCSQNCTVITI